ncbi:MAG: N-glycosylase/DNA lyase [Nanoarchaeota archaeon]|nr:N-glycosylase/DNA lyase [Nanoarchaeota archaeon]MCG2718417.1 N-glycosylase/DNA lyase [Nanoarchaeota archaeon]
MKNIKELNQHYSKRKSDIKNRLKEFKKIKSKSKEILFIELCFCLCTPLSKAKRVIEVINPENKILLTKGSQKDIAGSLKGYARFHNNKAEYIVEARDKMHLLENLPSNNLKARDFLVENFKGLGLKEAAHFLRNTGYNNLAILDGHIINCLHGLGALKSNSRPTSKKQYEEMARRFKNFSKKVNIPLDELDLLFWSSKTGCVLK